MAQIKISELEQLTELTDNDVIVGVDTETITTKKINMNTVKTFTNKEQDEEINNSKSSIRRLENNIFESGEATGESINIQDSVLSELTGFRAKAVNTQKTTEGNQLIDFSKQASDTKTTHTFENDVLTINADGSSSYQTFFKDITKLIKENAGKKIGFNYKSFNFTNNHNSSWVQVNIYYNDDTTTAYKSLLSNSMSKTEYTIPSDVSNVKQVVFSIYANTTPAMANTITIVKPLLYLDDNNVYEPYTGGLPSPSPSYPQAIPVIEAGEVVDVKSVGDNTFKFAKTDSEYNGLSFKKNADGSLTINGTAITNVSMGNLFNILFPKVEKGATLGVKVISGSVTSTAGNVKPRLVMHDDKYSANLIITNLNQMSIGEFKYSKAYADFVPYYSYIDWNVGDVFDNFTIQGFYSRSGKTEYTPYVESKITTSVPDGEFAGATNTIADEFYTEYNEEDKKEHLYLAKNVGRRLLAGTENWSVQQSGTANYFYQLYLGANTLANNSCITSHYTTKPIFTTNTNEGIYNTTEAFRVRYGTEKTLAEWKSQLAENNVTVLYGLVTPYVIDLGAVDQLKTWTDVTNILNNSSIPFNMTANYYRNFISTIRNLQVNNGALQTELTNLESRLSVLETSVSNLQVSQVNESEVAEDVI